MKRTIRTTAPTVGALITSLGLPAGTAHADTATPRVELRVLIVSDGGPATDAIAAGLSAAGTPYTEVDLRQSGRPVIDAGFLADTVDGVPRARFQAVVLPNDNPLADNTTVVNLQMKDIGIELRRRAAWKAAVGAGQVTAYRVGDTVTVQAPSGAAVTATMPTGTTNGTAGFGGACADGVSGWTAPADTALTLGLPSSSPALSSALDAARQPATSGAPDARIPAGVTEQVPCSAAN